MFFFSRSSLYRFLFVLGTLLSFAGDVTYLFYSLIVSFFQTYTIRVINNSYFQHYIDLSEFEQFYSNSGYWDFIILYSYDYYYRFICVYSLFAVSDFSLVERASWRFGYCILTPFVRYCLYSELRTFSELFLIVLFNLLCLFSFLIIIYIFVIIYI